MRQFVRHDDGDLVVAPVPHEFGGTKTRRDVAGAGHQGGGLTVADAGNSSMLRDGHAQRRASAPSRSTSAGRSPDRAPDSPREERGRAGAARRRAPPATSAPATAHHHGPASDAATARGARGGHQRQRGHANTGLRLAARIVVRSGARRRLPRCRLRARATDRPAAAASLPHAARPRRQRPPVRPRCLNGAGREPCRARRPNAASRVPQRRPGQTRRAGRARRHQRRRRARRCTAGSGRLWVRS